MSMLFTLTPAYTAELITESFEHEHLRIRRIVGREVISQLYRYEVLLVARERSAGATSLDPDDILGGDVRFDLLDSQGQPVRHIHGVVAGVKQCAHESALEHAAYELEIVPRAWGLTLVTTQEVLLDMTVPELISHKLARHDLAGYAEFRTSAQYPKREFVLQYRESDLALISRLAEHVGLSFYFEQHEDGEKMIFTDHTDGFFRAQRHGVAFSGAGEKQGVFEIAGRTRTLPATYVVQDYNHRHPQLDVTGVHRLDVGRGGAVEYGSHHKTPQEGNSLATIRAEEALSRRRVYEGRSDVTGFTAGARFELTDHPYQQDPGLLLTEVNIRFELTLGAGDDQTEGYENSFVAVPTTHNHRPPRLTPRPRIDGILTAVVQVTPDTDADGEARIDQQGYYTVQFHFDPATEGGRSSRPIRMAQPYEGPNEGMHFPLRPGTEVAIAFVDGDPDRPVIIGALPNAMAPSPVVAADANMHRIRSRYGLIVEFGTSG